MGFQWIVFIKGILLIAVAFQPMDVRVSYSKEPVSELKKPAREVTNESYGLMVHQISTNYELSR